MSINEWSWMDRNELTLTIEPYDWKGEVGFTYEIRGPNVRFSSVRFGSHKLAEESGKFKLEELNNG